MANDQNRERNIASTLSLRSLLTNVQKSPNSFSEDDNLVSSLESQVKFGHYQSVERGIYGTSLSTLKRIANTYIDGGFEALNRERIRAHQLLVTLQDERNKEPNENLPLTFSSNNLKNALRRAREDVFVKDGVILRLARLLTECSKEISSDRRKEFYLKLRDEELQRVRYRARGTKTDEH